MFSPRVAKAAIWALHIFLPTVITCLPESPDWMTVPTTSGIFKGHLAASHDSGVAEFLGIPYAEPPLGDLRFAAPRSIARNGTFEASEFGFGCPAFSSPPASYPGMTPQAQDIMASFASVRGATGPQGEDCLTLNIWTKGNGGSEDAPGKPVVIFIHGGRFSLGTSGSAMYNGSSIAGTEDIVLVTLNYRTNIFGFPGAPGGPQNLGLRDIRTAVEWLRDNVAGFGGDPGKMVLSGQSSGGVAAEYWTYAYKEDPIVRGVYASSGNAASFPLNPPEVAQSNWEIVVKGVNCTSAPDVMACMRRVKWEDIRDVASAVKVRPSNNVLRPLAPFLPVEDGEVVMADYITLTEAGDFVKLPTLYSNTHNEDGYYKIPALRGGIEPTLKEVDNFLLETFTCPNAHQARARLQHGAPAWVVRYFGDWPNTRLYPTSGAYHGVDWQMIFGASEAVTGLPASEPQRETARLMQRAIAAFARDPWSGLSAEMRWPRYSDEEESLVLVAVDNEPEARLVLPRTYDVFCSDVTLAVASGVDGAL